MWDIWYFYKLVVDQYESINTTCCIVVTPKKKIKKWSGIFHLFVGYRPPPPVCSHMHVLSHTRRIIVHSRAGNFIPQIDWTNHFRLVNWSTMIWSVIAMSITNQNQLRKRFVIVILLVNTDRPKIANILLLYIKKLPLH